MPSFKLIFLAINLVSALAVGIARAKKTAKRKVASLKTIEILVLAGLTLFLCCCCCLCCRCLCKKCPCTCCGHSKGKKAAQDEDSKVEADIEMPEPVLPRRPELCISDYKITPRQCVSSLIYRCSSRRHGSQEPDKVRAIARGCAIWRANQVLDLFSRKVWAEPKCSQKPVYG